MSGSLTKLLLGALILTGSALPVCAQNSADSPSEVPSRSASFMTDAPVTTAGSASFSGLAAAPELIPPPAAVTTAVSGPAATLPLDMTLQAPSDTLGDVVWKGTMSSVAVDLLDLANVTSSPVLNDLMRRLLLSTAASPEGSDSMAPTLTAKRAIKLAELGEVSASWALATHSDIKLIDDVTFHSIAENTLANGDDKLCGQLPDIIKIRTNVDWQKILTVCQLRTKDTKAAQVSLDVLRTQTNRDDMFLEVADRNVLGDSKTLPPQLTPLSPSMLALLALTNQPLPGELYGHPDSAIIPALLRAPAKQDVAQLGLAERASARGLISQETLEALYQGVSFTPEEFQSPLNASTTGSRLRALMYKAAMSDKDSGHKITYAIKFVASTPPEFLGGVGKILGDMLGSLKPDQALAANAISVAQIYMLAGKGADALDWLRLARTSSGDKLLESDDYRFLWPQFALAGLESEADFQTDLDHWLDAILKAPDAQTDMHMPREIATTALLFLDALGFKIADTSWSKVLALPLVNKHLSLSTLFLERLREVSQEGRRAETILVATDLAGENDISLPSAIEIARALRIIGFKSEAAIFAQQDMATLNKAN